jgi:3-(3-hydroxy-phenyl)propionate hydroxylase
VLLDAPLQKKGQSTWLLRELGPDFTLLVFGPASAWTRDLPCVHVLQIGLDVTDHQALAAQRLDALPGTAYLVRPDQHVCARWRAPTEAAVRAALAHATATSV